MSTPLAEFYEPVRALLGDFNPSVRQYADSSIATVLQTLIRGGRLAGYALTPDRLSITPDVLDPDHWILLAYKAAFTFVLPESAGYAYRMRAVSETFGDRKHVLVALEGMIHEIENGKEMFGSWQSLAGWLAGQVGPRRELWRHLVRVKDATEIGSLTIGPGGTFPEGSAVLSLD